MAGSKKETVYAPVLSVFVVASTFAETVSVSSVPAFNTSIVASATGSPSAVRDRTNPLIVPVISRAVARMTGLKRSPFWEIVLPRITKLFPKSKSNTNTAPSDVTERGASNTTFTPVRPALGNLIPGILVPVSTSPFVNVIDDLSTSRINRKPRYVPVANVVCPRLTVLPP